MPGLKCSKALKTFARNFYEFFLFGSDLSDEKGSRRVAVITVKFNSDVHGNDLTFFDVYFVRRYSVNDFLVNGNTGRSGITFVIKERRFSPTDLI